LAEQAIQGRGVLLDLRRHFGDGHTLVSGRMLKQVMEQDGIRVGKGDIVALYTGFSELLLACNRQPPADMPQPVTLLIVPAEAGHAPCPATGGTGVSQP
ncbi:MAG: cyclase family protein, partial [Rhodocyclaceae bacterium]